MQFISRLGPSETNPPGRATSLIQRAIPARGLITRLGPSDICPTGGAQSLYLSHDLALLTSAQRAGHRAESTLQGPAGRKKRGEQPTSTKTSAHHRWLNKNASPGPVHTCAKQPQDRHRTFFQHGKLPSIQLALAPTPCLTYVQTRPCLGPPTAAATLGAGFHSQRKCVSGMALAPCPCRRALPTPMGYRKQPRANNTDFPASVRTAPALSNTGTRSHG